MRSSRTGHASGRPLKRGVRPHVNTVRPQRLRKLIPWLVASGAAALLAVWLLSRLSNCQYRETSPAYSPDGKFYTQMEFTLCRDFGKSHSRLVMGALGRSEKSVLLEFGPSIGTVNVAWHEGPELRVEAPEFAITGRYGPYDNLPRVVVTSP
jgi:hypothetical protein